MLCCAYGTEAVVSMSKTIRFAGISYRNLNDEIEKVLEEDVPYLKLEDRKAKDYEVGDSLIVGNKLCAAYLSSLYGENPCVPGMYGKVSMIGKKVTIRTKIEVGGVSYYQIEEDKGYFCWFDGDFASKNEDEEKAEQEAFSALF